MSERRFARTFRGFVVGLLLAGVLAPGSVGAQVVSPVQGGAYVPALINIRDQATPPPGLFFVWYNWFGGSDTFVDRNQDAVRRLNLSTINPALPDVDVDIDVSVYAAVPALFFSSPFTLLGGARYLATVSTSWVDSDVTLTLGVDGSPAGGVSQSAGVSGWGDLFVAPIGLSWQKPSFDVTTTYGFYAPTGRYETGGDDNIGLGHWTHQFQGFGYYYPVESRATAMMFSLTWELPGQIEESEVTPGNRLSVEWGLSQYLATWFELGVQGGHNWQVTDDSGAGVLWDPSVHDKKSTLMFSAGFWPWESRLYVAARYGFDFGARQRFDTGAFMINLVFATDLLTGG